jgi:Flp pilus assembly protein protease CpaA
VTEPDDRLQNRRASPLEIAIVVVTVAAIVAMAVWFVFFAVGGIGPGTV